MASSSTSDNTIETILLKSMDDEYYEVDESVAKMSRTIKHMIEDVGNSDPIPLPNVSGKILTKVIEYCYKHVDFINNSDNDASVKEELKEWDQNFLQVDQNTLFDLILAANYLDLKGLLDLSCQHVASMMKGKSPEEIRETFHIKNDYTPEQEEEVRKENAWAFE